MSDRKFPFYTKQKYQKVLLSNLNIFQWIFPGFFRLLSYNTLQKYFFEHLKGIILNRTQHKTVSEHIKNIFSHRNNIILKMILEILSFRRWPLSDYFLEPCTFWGYREENRIPTLLFSDLIIVKRNGYCIWLGNLLEFNMELHFLDDNQFVGH